MSLEPVNEHSETPRVVAGAGCATLVLIFGVIGLAAGLSAAAFMALLALFGPPMSGLASASAALAALALLGTPLLWQAWLRMRGAAPRPWRTRRWWIGLALLAAPAALISGQLLSRVHSLPLVVREPLLWLTLLTFAAALLALMTDGWPGLSQLRAWGHLISGSWLATTLSLLVQGPVVVALATVGLAVLAAFAPDDFSALSRLARNPMALANSAWLLEWLTRPYIVAGLLVVASVVVPLIEELLKPIGVWVLGRRRLTPMAAFVGGALGGLGFALFEACLNSANVGRDQWAGFVMGRLGTTVMHVCASALAGWGIGQLFGGRWLRALGAYLGAVLLHGLWNGNVIVASLGAGLLTQASNGSWQQITLGGVVVLTVLILIGLVLTSTFTLMLVGRWLRDLESPLR